MIDPSSSEEESDDEGVEEVHHHSQRVSRQEAVIAASSFNQSHHPSSSLPAAHPSVLGSSERGGGGNLGSNSITGTVPSVAASTYGSASNSLDVPASSSTLPRYIHNNIDGYITIMKANLDVTDALNWLINTIWSDKDSIILIDKDVICCHNSDIQQLVWLFSTCCTSSDQY